MAYYSQVWTIWMMWTLQRILRHLKTFKILVVMKVLHNFLLFYDIQKVKIISKAKALKKTDGDVIREMSLEVWRPLWVPFTLMNLPIRHWVWLQEQYAEAIDTRNGKTEKVLTFLNSKSLDSKYHLAKVIDTDYLPFALRFIEDLKKSMKQKLLQKFLSCKWQYLVYCRYLEGFSLFRIYGTMSTNFSKSTISFCIWERYG